RGPLGGPVVCNWKLYSGFMSLATGQAANRRRERTLCYLNDRRPPAPSRSRLCERRPRRPLHRPPRCRLPRRARYDGMRAARRVEVRARAFGKLLELEVVALSVHPRRHVAHARPVAEPPAHHRDFGRLRLPTAVEQGDAEGGDEKRAAMRDVVAEWPDR